MEGKAHPKRMMLANLASTMISRDPVSKVSGVLDRKYDAPARE
jgi:hypothetical protein